MNVQRAKQITESPRMVNVTADGEPVYIQYVDEDTGIARVYLLDDPGKEKNIPVDQLLEH